MKPKNNDFPFQIELFSRKYWIIHYDRMEHIKALDNYLIADQYISRVNNLALVYKIHRIALIKYYLGFYDRRFLFFKENV